MATILHTLSDAHTPRSRNQQRSPVDTSSNPPPCTVALIPPLAVLRVFLLEVCNALISCSTLYLNVTSEYNRIPLIERDRSVQVERALGKMVEVECRIEIVSTGRKKRQGYIGAETLRNGNVNTITEPLRPPPSETMTILQYKWR